MGQEKITLTKAELKKVLVIEKLVARQIKVAEAAELLQLSTRQVLRLKKLISRKELKVLPIRIAGANLYMRFRIR
jgi:predicted HTH domain antitoxin